MTVGEIRRQAAKDADEILTKYWDGSFPVNPVPIARDLGASVFLAQLGDDEYGRLESDSAGPNIYIDRDQPAKRKVFTCAHEIGHLVSHADEPEAVFVDKRSDEGRGTASEIYANEFAGNLLMPPDEVRELHTFGEDAASMADHFGVSLQAMSYRLRVLGLLSQ
ncbi:ImmA/IrrE family metallo-endopeptidase [Actinomyces succiniciruminis]|nr:ImmA/IrrE family metallo-endopeptidase [Actinomyces succiniciruminis]